MATVLERDAKVTAQGQTTVPAPIREQLGIVPGDHITFVVDATGNVMLRRCEDGDPAIEAFLEFLAADIQRRPDQIQGLTSSLEDRLRQLTAKTKIDRKNDRIVSDVGL
jgi:antitoxin PrlF